MPDVTPVTEDERLAALKAVHDTVLRPVTAEFIRTIRSTEVATPFTGEGLIGLLTFPNSGTSWFMRITAWASGICNHTMYEKEVAKGKIVASRGAVLSPASNVRSPRSGDPSFVKSHVGFYGTADDIVHDLSDFEHYSRLWRRSLPPNCDRHVRLVRDPLDNLRARYHHYLKANPGVDPGDLVDFRTYFRGDLRRYLQWHAYCDDLATGVPVMTVRYEEILDPVTSAAAFGRAMRFAGHDIEDAAIAAVVATDPPKYVADPGVPVHLRHFDEEDIRWIAARIGEWTDLLNAIRRPGPVMHIRRLLRRRRSG